LRVKTVVQAVGAISEVVALKHGRTGNVFDPSSAPALPRCVTDLPVRPQPRKDCIAGGSQQLRGPYNRVKQDGLLLRA